MVSLWDQLQTAQTNFCFPQELASYYASQQVIDDAKNALDVGCGNGDFMRRFAGHFPNIHWTGIDVIGDLLPETSDDGSVDMKYFQDDFFNHKGEYDLVITRLFWQHIPERLFVEGFEKLRALIGGKGTVFVVDASDSDRLFAPPLTCMTEIMDEYGTLKKNAEGCRRDAINAIANHFYSSGDWMVGLDQNIVVPSTLPNNLEYFRRSYNLVLDLFQETHAVRTEISAARAELESWFNGVRPYTQVGIRVLRLDAH